MELSSFLLLTELMLLGFISLLLTVSQNFIAKICVPENVVNDLLPCNLSDKKTEEGLKSNSTTSHFQSFFPGTISGTVRRLLAETSEANLGYCAKKVTFIYFLNCYCCCSLSDTHLGLIYNRKSSSISMFVKRE